jgi:Suppressor of fused protein (SUFU)
MSFFRKLFGGQKKEEPISGQEFTQEQYDKDYEEKEKGLETVLGKMNGIVGHAIIPFEVGGAVDMYYFQNHIQGTGFATMELLDPNGNGPKPNRIGTYELVAFTSETYNESEETPTPFNLIERRVYGIFTTIGNYSFQAVLNPNETCEVPTNGEDNRCLVFDNYRPGSKEFKIGDRKHHLLLCLEIFRSEMEFARKNGSEELLDKLKAVGHYPYSDLDREPVA